MQGGCVIEEPGTTAEPELPAGYEVVGEFRRETTPSGCGTAAYALREHRVVSVRAPESRIRFAYSALTPKTISTSSMLRCKPTDSCAPLDPMTSDGTVLLSVVTRDDPDRAKQIFATSVFLPDGTQGPTIDASAIPLFNPQGAPQGGRYRQRIVPASDAEFVWVAHQSPALGPRGEPGTVVDVRKHRRENPPSGLSVRRFRASTQTWSPTVWVPVSYPLAQDDRGFLVRTRTDGSLVAALSMSTQTVVVGLSPQSEVLFERTLPGLLFDLSLGPSGETVVSTGAMDGTTQQVFLLGRNGRKRRTRGFGVGRIDGLIHAGTGVHAVKTEYVSGRFHRTRLVLDPRTLATRSKRSLPQDEPGAGPPEVPLTATSDGGFVSVLSDRGRNNPCNPIESGATVMRFDRQARLVWAERLGVLAPADEPAHWGAFEISAVTTTSTGIRIAGRYKGQMVVPEAWEAALPPTKKPPGYRQTHSQRAFVLELSDHPPERTQSPRATPKRMRHEGE